MPSEQPAMTDLSSAVESAVRAVRGESDLDAVRPALDEDDLARIIANAPERASPRARRRRAVRRTAVPA